MPVDYQAIADAASNPPPAPVTAGPAPLPSPKNEAEVKQFKSIVATPGFYGAPPEQRRAKIKQIPSFAQVPDADLDKFIESGRAVFDQKPGLLRTIWEDINSPVKALTGKSLKERFDETAQDYATGATGKVMQDAAAADRAIKNAGFGGDEAVTPVLQANATPEGRRFTHALTSEAIGLAESPLTYVGLGESAVTGPGAARLVAKIGDAGNIAKEAFAATPVIAKAVGKAGEVAAKGLKGVQTAQLLGAKAFQAQALAGAATSVNNYVKDPTPENAASAIFGLGLGGMVASHLARNTKANYDAGGEAVRIMERARDLAWNEGAMRLDTLPVSAQAEFIRQAGADVIAGKPGTQATTLPGKVKAAKDKAWRLKQEAKKAEAGDKLAEEEAPPPGFRGNNPATTPEWAARNYQSAPGQEVILAERGGAIEPQYSVTPQEPGIQPASNFEANPNPNGFTRPGEGVPPTQRPPMLPGNVQTDVYNQPQGDYQDPRALAAGQPNGQVPMLRERGGALEPQYTVNPLVTDLQPAANFEANPEQFTRPINEYPPIRNYGQQQIQGTATPPAFVMPGRGAQGPIPAAQSAATPVATPATPVVTPQGATPRPPSISKVPAPVAQPPVKAAAPAPEEDQQQSMFAQDPMVKEGAVAPEWKPGDPPPSKDNVVRVDPKILVPDPIRFQYKGKAIGKGGTDDRFRDVKEYDQKLGGNIVVWRDPQTGVLHPTDGHHRTELAQRTGAPFVNVIFSDAPTAAAARTEAALLNIGNDKGEAIDAAKIFRDASIPVEQINKLIAPSSKLGKQGMAIAKLSPKLFRMVVDEEMSPERGAVIGEKLAGDDALQDQAFDYIAKREAKGRRYTEREIGSMVDRFKASNEDLGAGEAEQGGLFGDVVAKNYIDELVDVEEAVRAMLKKDRALFSALSKAENIELAEAKGNVIKGDANRQVADQAKTVIGLFEKLLGKSGPVEDILQVAAKEMAAGKSAKNAAAGAYPEIKAAVERLIDGRPEPANIPRQGGAGPGLDPGELGEAAAKSIQSASDQPAASKKVAAAKPKSEAAPAEKPPEPAKRLSLAERFAKVVRDAESPKDSPLLSRAGENLADHKTLIEAVGPLLPDVPPLKLIEYAQAFHESLAEDLAETGGKDWPVEDIEDLREIYPDLADKYFGAVAESLAQGKIQSKNLPDGTVLAYISLPEDGSLPARHEVFAIRKDANVERAVNTVPWEPEPFVFGAETDRQLKDLGYSPSQVIGHSGFVAGDVDQGGNGDPSKILSTGVNVDKQYRRKGIASAMYDYAEEMTGMPVVPSKTQTPDAVAFTAGRKSKLDRKIDEKAPSKEVVKAAGNEPAAVDAVSSGAGAAEVEPASGAVGSDNGRVAGDDGQRPDNLRNDAGAGQAGNQPDGENARPPVDFENKRVITAGQRAVPPADTSVIPPEIAKYLKPQQLSGAADAISALNGPETGFLVADGTGAGKSLMSLTVAKHFAAKGFSVLIVSKAEAFKFDYATRQPTGTYAQWSKTFGVPLEGYVGPERDKFVTKLEPGKVYAATYDTVYGMVPRENPKKPGVWSKGSPGIAQLVDGNTVVIMDEAHSAKNSGGGAENRANAGVAMANKAGKVLMMTATPGDKPAHIQYLQRIGLLEGKSQDQQFTELGFKKKITKGKDGKEVVTWNVDNQVGKRAVRARLDDLFNRLIANGQMVKREIAMDGVNIEMVPIELPEEGYDVMDLIEGSLSNGAGLKGVSGLQKAVILGHMRRAQETYKIPHVVGMVKEEIAAGRKVVIFVDRVNDSDVIKRTKVMTPHGVETLEELIHTSEGTAGKLKKALMDMGLTAEDIAEIHGEADENSIQAMGRFQDGDAKVVIATIASGGTGINLDDQKGTSPRTMIIMTAPFDGVGNVQAIGRIWRMATMSGAKVRYVFANTATDHWNMGIIADKMKTLGAIVQGEAKGAMAFENIKGNKEIRQGFVPEGDTLEDEDAVDAPAGSAPKALKGKGGKELPPPAEGGWLQLQKQNTYENREKLGKKGLGGEFDRFTSRWQIPDTLANRDALAQIKGIRIDGPSNYQPKEKPKVEETPEVRAINEKIRADRAAEMDRLAAESRERVGFAPPAPKPVFGAEPAAGPDLADAGLISPPKVTPKAPPAPAPRDPAIAALLSGRSGRLPNLGEAPKPPAKLAFGGAKNTQDRQLATPRPPMFSDPEDEPLRARDPDIKWEPGKPLAELKADTPASRRSRGEVATYLNKQVRKSLGALSVNAGEKAKIARLMNLGRIEIADQLAQKNNGAGFYSKDTPLADADMIRAFPELAEPRKLAFQKVLSAVLANNQDPNAEAYVGAKVYEQFQKTGVIPATAPNGAPWPGRGSLDQMQKLEKMRKEMGVDGLVEFLVAPQRLSDIAKWRPSVYVSKAKADTYAPGFLVLGDKIGPYWGELMQLRGQESTPIDKWDAAGQYRRMGRLIEAGKPKETPDNDDDRQIFMRSHGDLAKEFGLDRPGTAQSLLWHYEKSLYSALGADSKAEMRSNGTARYLEERGVTNEPRSGVPTDGRGANNDRADRVGAAEGRQGKGDDGGVGKARGEAGGSVPAASEVGDDTPLLARQSGPSLFGEDVKPKAPVKPRSEIKPAPTNAPFTYFTGSTNAALEQRAAEKGDLGLLVTPLLPSYQGKIDKYPVIAIDNGVFSKSQPFDAGKFRDLIESVASKPEQAAKVRFVVAPDVVGDAKATLAKFKPWADEIHKLGLPVAFAAQDGIEHMADKIPWDDMDVLFIGGSTDWKIGEGTGAEWSRMLREAKKRGVEVHVGRVNSMRRMEISDYGMGASSADGTGAAFHPDRTVDLHHSLDRINSGEYNWKRLRNATDEAQFEPEMSKKDRTEVVAGNMRKYIESDKQARSAIREAIPQPAPQRTKRPPSMGLFEAADDTELAKQDKERLLGQRLTAQFNSQISAQENQAKLKKKPEMQENFFEALPDDDQTSLFLKGMNTPVKILPNGKPDTASAIRDAKIRIYSKGGNRAARVYLNPAAHQIIMKAEIEAGVAKPGNPWLGAAMKPVWMYRIIDEMRSTGKLGSKVNDAELMRKMDELADQLEDAVRDSLNPMSVSLIAAEGAKQDVEAFARHEQQHADQYAVEPKSNFKPAELFGQQNLLKIESNKNYQKAGEGLMSAGYPYKNLPTEVMAHVVDGRLDDAGNVMTLGVTPEEGLNLYVDLLEAAVATKGRIAYTLVQNAARPTKQTIRQIRRSRDSRSVQRPDQGGAERGANQQSPRAGRPDGGNSGRPQDIPRTKRPPG
tara:strand:- start:1930 stop:11712 length:9783 start_codon:yes stop_codon:yes gene_type:complete